jgi:TonB family protein
MSHRFRLYSTAFLLLLVFTATIPAQDQQKLKVQRSSDRNRIPDVSVPCSEEEAQWWNRLKTAGEELRADRKNQEKKQAFLSLLQEGQEKSYQVPIQDHKAIVLVMNPPHYSEAGRQAKVGGEVEMRLELRADGFVGEVENLRGLGFGLDENAVEAARKTIFLPAVKDRKFVTSKNQMSMSFNVY